MIASLMMYRRPQLDEAHEHYWQLIRQNLQLAGIDSPSHLSQDAEEFYVWKHPELVLSQTCGMPYRIWLHDRVQLVEFQNAVFAYNQTFSQSGYAAPYWHLKPYGFWFENRLHTQQHLLSALAVAEGRADIAALDAVSWRLMSEHDAFANSLRVLEWTKPTPGLPLITAKDKAAERIYDAVKSAIEQLGESDRTLLGLQGIVRINKDQYTAIPNPPQTGTGKFPRG